ncbi:hypothetical protein ACXIUS_01620 [Bosea thiooxidans]
MVSLSPVILANDPLPAETIQEADTLCHRAGDMLMCTSALSGAMRRNMPLDGLEAAIMQIADEARCTMQAAVRIGETIAMLKARAAR